MFKLKIADVNLELLPPPDAVSLSGGGRPVTERRALDGRIVALRSTRPESRRLQVTAPENHVITRKDAEAIRALGFSVFTVILEGYEGGRVLQGCTFEEPPRFPEVGHPDLVSYDFTLYIAQETA